jgi:hypothetical protein
MSDMAILRQPRKSSTIPRDIRGHNESRKSVEGCLGAGGVDLLAGRLPVDDGSMAKRVEMAA